MEFREKKLSDNLLKHQFKTQTNWIVFSGAPCAGKSTVLTELKRLGYSCCAEVARAYIERSLKDGLTLSQIRSKESEFQKALIEEKLLVEKNTDPAETVFFDRAMPDTITYYRISGLDPDSVLKYCFNYRYKKVFIFDPLKFRNDDARTEDPETVKSLDIWLEKDYKALGYNVTRVPVMTVSERIEFILKKIL